MNYFQLPYSTCLRICTIYSLEVREELSAVPWTSLYCVVLLFIFNSANMSLRFLLVITG